MKSKTAELSAGLVAIKGTALPSPDMYGREGSPITAGVSLSIPEAADTDAAPPKTVKMPAARKAKPPEGKEANLAPLNFRIPASFRREFKTYAATHDLKLNELLRRSFEAYRRQQRD